MAQVNVRIDDDVKKEAEEVLDEMGMPMTTAVTIFLKTEPVVTDVMINNRSCNTIKSN